MKVFRDLQEYTKWFMERGSNLSAYAFQVVKVESLNKLICVCGSPQAIESLAERAARTFMVEWNSNVDKDCELNADVDLDLVSDLRDTILEVFAKYKNMEIVFVSTEY